MTFKSAPMHRTVVSVFKSTESPNSRRPGVQPESNPSLTSGLISFYRLYPGLLSDPAPKIFSARTSLSRVPQAQSPSWTQIYN